MAAISSRINLPPASPRFARAYFAPRSGHMRKRRRLNILAGFGPPPIISLQWDSLFHGLSAVLASANWSDLILPAVGFGSGVAFYRSGGGTLRRSDESSLGRTFSVADWTLIASPTPFNRCVFLRCPSLSFGDGRLLLDAARDLKGSEQHSAAYLSRGQILPAEEADPAGASDISFQRLCVGTDDGGVISLDWPEHLVLTGEQALDTTVLVVPGTAEGSMDGEIRAFVREVLNHGCFPIVMNPRGCAGSPLTTPRLFAAADSDDINAAVRFINRSRPWTTLMGIGWGYGANMLTKYLAEVGERTPLTAAVCIDTPFDLKEAARSDRRPSPLEEKLTGGLIEILQANKELFKGKNKGFDVVKALSASQLRDFEAAISMVSYGFESIEEFYSKSSTRDLVDRVKIPLLFIQNEDEIIPLCSVPQSSIAENPFTSLLMCSCSPNSLTIQNLAIEWFSAVELALLKGRHPLLNNVDITITPPKSLPDLEERLQKDNSAEEKGVFFSEIGSSKALSDVSVIPVTSFLVDNSNEKNVTHEGEDDMNDRENGPVLGAAGVILNMLDHTMPGTLDDEQKKKILTATEHGETFMKALEEAVPEDVRGKLTSSVSGIIQAQGSKINTDILRKLEGVPGMFSVKEQKIPEDPNGIYISDDEKTGIIGQDFHSSNSCGPHSSNYEEKDGGNRVSSEPEMEISLDASIDPHVKENTFDSSVSVNENGNDQITVNPDNSPVKPPSISVSKAFDALTGFDDSTQMAMNSVFGVIENMIDQLEKETDKIDGEGDEDALESDEAMKESKDMEIKNQITDAQGDENNNDMSGNLSHRKLTLDHHMNPYWGISYESFFDNSMLAQISKVKSPDLEPTADLFLDPEEGQWKMLDSTENIDFAQNANEMDSDKHLRSMLKDTDKDTPDLFLNSENQTDHGSFGKEELILLIRDTVLKALKVEVSRRLGDPDLHDTDSSIMHDILHVSSAISSAVTREGVLSTKYLGPTSSKLGTIQGQAIIRTISYAVPDTSLGEMLPVGVIVGSTLASLRKYFHVTVLHDEYKAKDENGQQTLGGEGQESNLHSTVAETSTASKGTVVAGAVTAALGASALLAHHKRSEANTPENTADFSSVRLQEDMPQGNLVSTLAEKAMSIAGPVVPTTEDGEVDHERLVASLAELGQRGGFLRFIGKAALLWGGMRGAVSLIDRLISFLQIAQRPLLQRVLGFFCMVLIMWSPVVIPLIPTLVESWRTASRNSVAEYACIWGFYAAVMILVVLWGQRIREYEDPLQQYGIRFNSSEVRLFLKGFLGGVILVIYVHSINALLGYASLAWPPVHPSSSVDAVKTYAWMIVKTLQGVVMATGVAAVEELLFRSWLPEEIAADLGYLPGVLIPGLIFSIFQRSLVSIPGFLFLSLALCGAKQRAGGSLFLPIGIRTGIVAVNFSVQAGGLLSYRPDTPIWLASSYPWRPFDGAAGLAICLLLAIYLRPRGLLCSDAET